ncbi:MAG: 4'-phosphopantetheinyl transferase superfamily protein [Halomonas sp.]
MTPSLDMLLVQAPADSSRACLSRLGRELLSQLTAAHGFHCPVDEWTPRGCGAPRHPALPYPWKACLSHRGLRVIAGIATVPVGIDIEQARSRHRNRLSGLVACLPEADVRREIMASTAPLSMFYRAWTLHEALFKLDSLCGKTPHHVLDTRLSRLLPGGGAHAWLWQHGDWTISICCQYRSLRIRSLPSLSVRKNDGRLNSPPAWQ